MRHQCKAITCPTLLIVSGNKPAKTPKRDTNDTFNRNKAAA